MSYRSIHKANVSYELAVMWLLIIAFLVAVPLMFVHPLAVLALFFSGLVILVVTIWIEKLIHRSECAAARQEMIQHQCPSCGAEIDCDPQMMVEWRCKNCGSIFLSTGQIKQEGDFEPQESLMS